MEADKTKCLAEEEEAGIMDIFIIRGRGKADGRQTKVVVVTSQRRRSAIPELRSNWSTLPPHNKYWWKRYIYTRTTSPSAEKKQRDLLGRGLATTAISAPIIHQAEPPGQFLQARRTNAREIPVSRSIRYSLRECCSTQIFLFKTRLDPPLPPLSLSLSHRSNLRFLSFFIASRFSSLLFLSIVWMKNKNSR